MKLHLSSELQLPLDSVTQKLGFLGTTGSGKTYAASKLAEEMLDAGAQIVVLDPVGVWYGLRLNKSGIKPSHHQVPIFGGLHGDVPLEPTAGALVANLIVDRGISVIIDVSQFESDAQKARFAGDFADRFFFRKKASPSAVHLFIEEVQEFCPQNPQKEETKMLHAFTRMQKLGRNFGIGSSYITQRPQEVSKKALNMAQTLFVFRCTGSQERAAIDKWIDDKALDLDIADDLPKLPTGTCHVWSPEFLKVSRLVQIAEKQTFNASSTPEVGVVAKARQLAPIDLERIKSDILATIEKAKAEDPAELKRRIKELEVKLKQQPAVQQKVKEISVLKDAQIARLEKALVTLENMSNKHGQAQALFWQNFDEVAKALLGAMKQVDDAQKVKTMPLPKDFIKTKDIGIIVSQKHRAPLRSDDPRLSDGRKLDRCARAILNVLAQRKSTTRQQAAILSGYSVNSGGFANSLSMLRSNGFIDGMAITAAGIKEAGDVQPMLEGEALHSYWYNKLDKCSRTILARLIEIYTDSSGRTELGIATGYSADSGGFANSLSTLRTLELITRGTDIKASDDLFQ